MPKEQTPEAVLRRLPRYYRLLEGLKNSGVVRVSSRELAEQLGFTASQIRQDLNRYGGFGQQGYGYNVAQLQGEIARILGLQTRRTAILLGAGNLGRAVAGTLFAAADGFELLGIFDRKESLTGQLIRKLPIRHIDGLDEFCREYRPQVAVLCLPGETARAITPSLAALGVRALWNFSAYDPSADFPSLAVENVRLGDSLLTLSYKLSHQKEERL